MLLPAPLLAGGPAAATGAAQGAAGPAAQAQGSQAAASVGVIGAAAKGLARVHPTSWALGTIPEACPPTDSPPQLILLAHTPRWVTAAARPLHTLLLAPHLSCSSRVFSRPHCVPPLPRGDFVTVREAHTQWLPIILRGFMKEVCPPTTWAQVWRFEASVPWSLPQPAWCSVQQGGLGHPRALSAQPPPRACSWCPRVPGGEGQPFSGPRWVPLPSRRCGAGAVTERALRPPWASCGLL